MIGIVGGGLTGLALTHALAGRGVEALTLEAASEPGGVMRSVEREGRILELGPQRGRLTPGFRKLARELALEDQLITVPDDLPLYVLSRGRLRIAPLSPGAFFTTSLLSPLGRARMLLEPLTGGPRPGEDVAGFLSRKFGRQAYERFLGPLYGGLYASDPAEMEVELSLAHALRELGVGRSLLAAAMRRGVDRRTRKGDARRAGRTDSRPDELGDVRGGGAAACSFVSGMQALPRALAERYREQVRLGSPVTAIRPRHGTEGFRLVTATEEVPVQTAVLTVPAQVAATLLVEVAPEAARRLATLRYNPLAVVHLLARDADDADRLRGYGYQVAFGENGATRGVTWNHALFPGEPSRRGAFTAYLGGMADPAMVQEADEHIGPVAAREFTAATGVEVRPVHVHRTRVPAWDRSWRALEELSLPRGLVLEGAYTARPGIPGRLARARALAGELAGQAVAG